MTLDTVLTHFKAGTLTLEEARAWIFLERDMAVANAKIALCDKLQIDIGNGIAETFGSVALTAEQRERDLDIMRSRGEL